jgi:cell division septal protein FtsQ
MELNKSIKFKVDSINYSYVNGWDVQTDSTLIRFGKNISDMRLKNFHNTVNYLYENRKIPSIIDMRYKDGAALSYGK